jgi:hypothetical protein
MKKIQVKERTIKKQKQLPNMFALLLVIGKILGIFPLKNPTDVEKIHFQLVAWPSLYACSVWLINVVISIRTLHNWIFVNFHSFGFGNAIQH